MEREIREEKDELTYVAGLGFADPCCIVSSRNVIRIYSNAISYSLLAFLALQYAAPVAAIAMLKWVNPAIRIYKGSFLASGEIIEAAEILVSLICYLPPILMLAAAFRKGRKEYFPMKRVPAGTAVPALGLVLGASAIGSCVSGILVWTLNRAGLDPLGPSLPQPDTAPFLLLSVISCAVIPAVCEELLFRGVILQSLRRFGDGFALAVATLLFAFLHRNLIQLPTALISGFVLGFLALRTGSLAVPIFCHFINNLIPILMQAAALNLPDAWQGLLLIGMNLTYLLLMALSLAWFVRARPEILEPFRRCGGRQARMKYISYFSSIPTLLLSCFLLWMLVQNTLNW